MELRVQLWLGWVLLLAFERLDETYDTSNDTVSFAFCHMNTRMYLLKNTGT